jgi:hypothetical protein
VPRFQIAWVMVAVAIAALDFGAMRALSDWDHSLQRLLWLLLLGALPMMNVLTVGILIRQQRPGTRPFLLGFEAFGALALAFYIALLGLITDSYEPIDSYLALWVEPMEKILGHDRPLVFVPIVCFGCIVMLGWPQVAFALIGGFLSRRLKITPR